MAKKFDVWQELIGKGFEEIQMDYGFCLTKTYRKEIEVLWYGKSETSIRVDVFFSPDKGTLKALYYDRDISVRPFKEKVHLNEKRAFNAISDTVRNNGFEI